MSKKKKKKEIRLKKVTHAKYCYTFASRREYYYYYYYYVKNFSRWHSDKTKFIRVLFDRFNRSKTELKGKRQGLVENGDRP